MKRITAAILILFTIVQYLIFSMIHADQIQAQSANILTNGDMLDADGDHLPDGWQGIELTASDGVVCGEHCKFVFTGAPFQRTLHQTATYTAPQGARFKYTTNINFNDVGYGSYMQVIGTLNGSLTTVYLLEVPEGKQKRSMTIAGVVGYGGVDHMTVLYTITSGTLKVTNASLTFE